MHDVLVRVISFGKMHNFLIEIVKPNEAVEKAWRFNVFKTECELIRFLKYYKIS